MRKNLIQILVLTSFFMGACSAQELSCPGGDTIQLTIPYYPIGEPSFLILNTGPIASSQEECANWTPTTESRSIKFSAHGPGFRDLYTGTTSINDVKALHASTIYWDEGSSRCLLGSYITFRRVSRIPYDDSCQYLFCFSDNPQEEDSCIAPGAPIITLYYKLSERR